MPKNQVWLPVTIVLGILVWGIAAYVYKSVSKMPSNSTVMSIVKGTAEKKIPSEIIAYISNAVWSSIHTSGGIISKIAKWDTLQAWDTLRTDTGASIEIIYSDSSIVRIAEVSSYELRTNASGYLSAGSLWARIISPVGELGIFTVETSDLSAGIRWTAVLLTTSASGSECTVVDSSMLKDSVNIRAATSSGVIETTLSPEEAISTFDHTKTKKVKVNMQRLFTKKEIIQNLKKDIFYLSSLKTRMVWVPPEIVMQPIVGSTNTKIKAEIRVSLPTPTELQNFFESKAVELEYIQIYKSISESIDPENIARIRILFGDDLQLSEMKRILENFRRQNLTGADEIKKDSFQKIVNTLQEDISGFDKTFARNYWERMKKEISTIQKNSSMIEQGVSVDSVETLLSPSQQKPVMSGHAILLPRKPAISSPAIIR